MKLLSSIRAKVSLVRIRQGKLTIAPSRPNSQSEEGLTGLALKAPAICSDLRSLRIDEFAQSDLHAVAVA